jgi:hypothetical protein
MWRAKKRENLSSARHYDQIGFRFYTTKTQGRHSPGRESFLQGGDVGGNVIDCRAEQAGGARGDRRQYWLTVKLSQMAVRLAWNAADRP